jgi:hypothetical protein
MHFKYPRTPHLPWSTGGTANDKRLLSVDHLIGKKVVISTKWDGENTTMYRDYIHARSLSKAFHESMDWIKKFHAQIKYNIPLGWRICGENLFAKHSLSYSNLTSYFYVFSIWTDKNVALDWDETVEYCLLLGITPVDILYRGIFEEDLVRDRFTQTLDYSVTEGYVVRIDSSFKFEDFPRSVAKYVRANHVQTDQHWKFRKVVPNKLKE